MIKKTETILNCDGVLKRDLNPLHWYLTMSTVVEKPVWVSELVNEREWKGTRERDHEGLISYIVMSCSRTGTQLVKIINYK